jgi:hypothetical protein
MAESAFQPNMTDRPTGWSNSVSIGARCVRRPWSQRAALGAALSMVGGRGHVEPGQLLWSPAAVDCLGERPPATGARALWSCVRCAIGTIRGRLLDWAAPSAAQAAGRRPRGALCWPDCGRRGRPHRPVGLSHPERLGEAVGRTGCAGSTCKDAHRFLADTLRVKGLPVHLDHPPVVVMPMRLAAFGNGARIAAASQRPATRR